MIHGALLLCAGLTAVMCFADSMSPPGSARTPVAAPTCPDDTRFLDHVQFVREGYNPSRNPGDPPPPEIGEPIGAESPYAPALQNAFQLAPVAFQARLCGVTAIFVNGPTECRDEADCESTSWGYRAANAPTETFVAITVGLWHQTCRGGTAYALHCYESDLFNQVLGWDSADGDAPRYGRANKEADNFDMTILSALAHEVGHIRWAQVLNPDNPGKSYDPNNNRFCTGNGRIPNFFEYSWNTPITMPQSFADRSPNDRHLGDSPQISLIDVLVSRRDMKDLAPLLDRLHQNDAPWPSYFAAVSTDHDFVETYKFYVLINAQKNKIAGEGPLSSLPIYFSDGAKTYRENVPDDYFRNGGKASLRSKVSCVANVI
jgi:hypothetical protein